MFKLFKNYLLFILVFLIEFMLNKELSDYGKQKLIKIFNQFCLKMVGFRSVNFNVMKNLFQNAQRNSHMCKLTALEKWRFYIQ